MTKYFLVILFCFACLSLMLNSRFTHIVVEDASIIESYLKDSVQSIVLKQNHYLPIDTAHMFDDAVRDTPVANDPLVTSGAGKSPHKGLANPHSSHVAGLNCDKFGGPSLEGAQELVYWEDIPSDAEWVSPFHSKHRNGPTQYLTFEPDQGGWNNIRMAMETVLGMAFAMGRTLVLPPHQRMYLLTSKDQGQRNAFSFEHFFHMERIHEEHVGLDIISMKEFLEIVMEGTFVDPKTQKPLFPPGNRTDWDGADEKDQRELKRWLRNNITSTIMRWDPEQCLAAFPKTADPGDMDSLKEMHKHIMDTGGMPNYEKYVGKPNPVNASAEDRLKENSAERKELCLYDDRLQNARWVHWPMEHKGDMANRLLVHFYAFLYFQDWRTDLWMKRFIRDHVRYIDEIQCAAARVVQAIRKRVKERGFDNDFDTLHVRRGDFQYTVTRSDAPQIYEMTTQRISDNATVYIATDERDKGFFDPLKSHYDVVFLDDFMDSLEGVNSNYYGMIDQLVASRGRIFFGCWFSTFTGYINRLRGYHADDHQSPGFEDGIIPSYYYALKDRFLHMQKFYPVKKSFYAREFPTAWRLIDTGLED